MDRDPLVRLLLAGILAALVALVFQSSSGVGGLATDSGPRFSLLSERAGSPILFRLDGRTGETWKMELRGGGDRWKPVQEPGETAPSQDRSAPPSPQDATQRVPPPKPVIVPVQPIETPADPTLPPEDDVAGLARALARQDLERDIRLWTIRRLALKDEPLSTQALLAVLDDSDPKLVAKALTALAGRYDPRIAGAVAKAREHPEKSVREAALAFAAPSE